MNCDDYSSHCTKEATEFFVRFDSGGPMKLICRCVEHLLNLPGNTCWPWDEIRRMQRQCPKGLIYTIRIQYEDAVVFEIHES
jgi:hypothetical protein